MHRKWPHNLPWEAIPPYEIGEIRNTEQLSMELAEARREFPPPPKGAIGSYGEKKGKVAAKLKKATVSPAG